MGMFSKLMELKKEENTPYKKGYLAALENSKDMIKEYLKSAAPQVKVEMIASIVLQEEFNWNPEQNDAHIRIAREVDRFHKARWSEFLERLENIK